MKITVFDDFNRANETPVASPWTKPSGATLNVNLASNGLIGATSTGDRAIYYSGTWPSSHVSQATYTTISDGDAGVAVRVQTAANSWVHFVNRTVGNGGWLLESVVAGASFNTIAADPTKGGAANDVVSLEVTTNAAGLDNYVARVNGVIALQGTDNTLTGGSPGLSWFNISTVLDNWYGGALEVPVAPVTNSRHPGISPGDNLQSWRLRRGFTQDDTITAPSSVSASSATTDGADVLAASIDVVNAASSATTDGADTLAASVSVIAAASSATTDGADILAAAVAPIVAASSATTDGADVLAAAVAPIVEASSATTDGADVLLANVDNAIGAVSASVAVTDGADVLAAFIDTGANAAGAEYGKKKRFTVKRGDELLIFGSKQAALSVLMAEAAPKKQKAEPKPEPVPEQKIALPEVKAYAEKTGQTETYKQAFDSQQYEKLIAIFEQMRDEEEVELLLLHVA